MLDATVLVYSQTGVNSLKQKVYGFTNGDNLTGYLDLMGGTENNRASSLQNSTHIFLTKDVSVNIKKQDRLLIDGKQYEVDFIDNPVNLSHHLEIYLKVVT